MCGTGDNICTKVFISNSILEVKVVFNNPVLTSKVPIVMLLLYANC